MAETLLGKTRDRGNSSTASQQRLQGWYTSAFPDVPHLRENPEPGVLAWPALEGTLKIIF